MKARSHRLGIPPLVYLSVGWSSAAFLLAVPPLSAAMALIMSLQPCAFPRNRPAVRVEPATSTSPVQASRTGGGHEQDPRRLWISLDGLVSGPNGRPGDAVSAQEAHDRDGIG